MRSSGSSAVCVWSSTFSMAEDHYTTPVPRLCDVRRPASRATAGHLPIWRHARHRATWPRWHEWCEIAQRGSTRSDVQCENGRRGLPRRGVQALEALLHVGGVWIFREKTLENGRRAIPLSRSLERVRGQHSVPDPQEAIL